MFFHVIKFPLWFCVLSSESRCAAQDSYHCYNPNSSTLILRSGLIHSFNYDIFYCVEISVFNGTIICLGSFHFLYYGYYNVYSFTFLLIPLLCNCPHKSCQTSYKVKSPEKMHSSYQQNDC